jgi:hypothetical protein
MNIFHILGGDYQSKMKYLRFVLVLVSLGLILCCAPTKNQSNPALARSENATGLEETSTPLADTPTVMLTPTHAATLTPMALPTRTATESPNPIVTPTKIPKPTPTNTALPPPTQTVIPTASPTAPLAAPPTTTATVAVVAASMATEEQVKHGLGVYKQLYCGLCHQLDIAGTAGTFGPPHNGIGTLAAQRIQESQYTGKATTAAEYLHESIVDPKAFMVPGYENTQHQMPIYNFLSESDVAALVQLLLQQK